MEFPSLGIRGLGALAVALLYVVAPAMGENLLANPGFEDLAADRPVRWDHFVQAKPGAVAELSDRAHSGSYSVWLHTPSPYEKEPVNNWSQNIIADFGGETLQVSGYLRVEDAEEAAIWIQMWRKRPWGVMGAESTSTDMPVYGTKDWEEVSMSVEIPEGTDFITIRCVLLGTGSAWFDDISVTRVGKDEKENKDKDKSKEEPESVAAVAKESVESEPKAETETETVATEMPAADGTTASAPQDTVLPLVNQLESEVQRLRDANAILTDTLQEIQDVNQELLKEMLSVQAELRALRSERDQAEAPPLEDPARPRVPPLIPLSEAEKDRAR